MSSHMARIVRLGSVGGFAALFRGDLLEVRERTHWWSSEQLLADAVSLGIEVSPYIMDTTHVVGGAAVTSRRAAG